MELAEDVAEVLREEGGKSGLQTVTTELRGMMPCDHKDIIRRLTEDNMALECKIDTLRELHRTKDETVAEVQKIIPELNMKRE